VEEIIMKEAYIVSPSELPDASAKGAFKDTLPPEDLLAFILKAAVDKGPQLDPKRISKT
jgi:acetyl-CoA acetyltransferase